MAYVGIYYFWFVLLFKHSQLTEYIDSGLGERREIEIGKYAKPQNTVIIEVSLITLLFS